MVISAPKIRKKLPNHHKNVLKIKKNTKRISTKRIREFFLIPKISTKCGLGYALKMVISTPCCCFASKCYLANLMNYLIVPTKKISHDSGRESHIYRRKNYSY